MKGLRLMSYKLVPHAVFNKGELVFNKGEQKYSGSVLSGTAPQVVMAIKIPTCDDLPVSCQLVKKFLIQVSAWWVVDIEKMQVV